MKLPKQVAPVQRPSLIQPHTTVNIQTTSFHDIRDSPGSAIRLNLQHGANFNDPSPFEATVYSSRYQLSDRNIGISPTSMAMFINSLGI